LIALACGAHPGHLLQRHVEHLGRGHGVDVEPVAKRLFQRVDAGDMGEDAQLDLGIVERDQHLARIGDEGLADAPALLGADGMFCRFGSVEASRPVFAPAME
jgi:hypothetical protein